MLLRVILILCASLVFTSCKSKKEEETIMVPAQESYNKGVGFIKSGKFSEAADEFGKVYFQHPGEEMGWSS